MADDEKKSFPLKNIALWTGWYFVASYLIFLFVFDFNILHASDWARIPGISLHGFWGLCFGIALLAWVPAWLGGCAAIMKTGGPLFSLKKKKESENNAAAEEENAEEKDRDIKFPCGLPEEMRVPYTRMIRGQLSRNAVNCKVVRDKPANVALSVECKSDSGGPVADLHGGEPIADAEMLLPSDFDLEPESPNAPVFREITFGGDSSEPEPNAEEIQIETRGDKKFAVAIHDDDDFWIADSENWFASGKQKPSPAAAAIAAAKDADATPVLLLRSENIMDLESLREKWKSDGIKIIKDLSEL